MFDRYTENAREVIFRAKEEAGRVGSSCIESEHLLLGIMRSCEPALNEVLPLKDLEEALRADLSATAHWDNSSAQVNMPLSNQSKRILAYAAEESARLNSVGIGSGHLLLGVLRESESVGACFMVAHNVDLQKARQIMGMHSASPTGWARMAKRRYWVGITGQIALLILLGIGVAKSTVGGRLLLGIAAIWLVAALAWNKLGPSSFFLGLGKRNVTTIAITYALQLGLFASNVWMARPAWRRDISSDAPIVISMNPIQRFSRLSLSDVAVEKVPQQNASSSASLPSPAFLSRFD